MLYGSRYMRWLYSDLPSAGQCDINNTSSALRNLTAFSLGERGELGSSGEKTARGEAAELRTSCGFRSKLHLGSDGDSLSILALCHGQSGECFDLEVGSFGARLDEGCGQGEDGSGSERCVQRLGNGLGLREDSDGGLMASFDSENCSGGAQNTGVREQCRGYHGSGIGSGSSKVIRALLNGCEAGAGKGGLEENHVRGLGLTNGLDIGECAVREAKGSELLVRDGEEGLAVECILKMFQCQGAVTCVISALLAQREELEVLLLIAETSLNRLRNRHLGVGAGAVHGLSHIRVVIVIIVEERVDIIGRDGAGVGLLTGSLLALLSDTFSLLSLALSSDSVRVSDGCGGLRSLILRHERRASNTLFPVKLKNTLLLSELSLLQRKLIANDTLGNKIAVGLLTLLVHCPTRLNVNALLLSVLSRILLGVTRLGCLDQVLQVISKLNLALRQDSLQLTVDNDVGVTSGGVGKIGIVNLEEAVLESAAAG
ncbi:hypothetical protein HG530_003136 [Fusarium avenaceum]|nr:hypothetical protein HG530_003136 [Fusarium avenaceum]